MPRTPDYFPGQRYEESIQFLSGSVEPNNRAELQYVSGSGFIFNDEGTKIRFRRRLQNFIDDGPTAGFPSGLFKETLGGAFITDEIWWESIAKTRRVVHLQVTRSLANRMPLTESWVMYGDDGTSVVETATDVITYTNDVFETGRTRTIT